jgi:hypothetical protein
MDDDSTCASPPGTPERRHRTEGQTMSILMTRTRPTGRHRLGRPGLIPVTALVTVVRRGFFAALFRPAKHRGPVRAAPSGQRGRRAVPAAV